jgi:N-acyl homoserine lactone hydrolase
MRVHAIQVGWIRFPEGLVHDFTMRNVMFAALRGLRGPGDAIPILSYVVEHDDGHIVIDTGMTHALADRVMASRQVRRMCDVRVEADDEIGPQMRARGLRPEDVRLVLPTHLHFDHAGGIGHFPNAEVRVHRTEWETRTSLLERAAYSWDCQEAECWSESREPALYDLGPESYGPFDHCLPLTDQGDVVALPTPGHTKGHVAIAVRTSDLTLLFAGDHLLRQSFYVADACRGKGTPNLYARLTADTNRRLRRFVDQFPTMVLPTHDAEAAQNIERWEPIKIT